MQCPVCGDRMKEVERQGVSIDLCPGCKGVWLDRGELEKLIALSQSEHPPAGSANPLAAFLPGQSAWQPAAGPDHQGYGQGDHDRHRGHDHGHDRDGERRHGDHHDHAQDHERGYGQGSRRRGSWLGDLFGGDD